MQLEIFKAGKYRGQDYGKDFLDQVAGNYDPAYHEAPAVIGHPKENGPAYGWVKSLSVKDDTLVAELDEGTLDKQFVDLVSGGKFKKRSASFYMDLNGKGPYLRHLGFLGATPPEVKGLKEIQFKDAVGATGRSPVFEADFCDGGMVAGMFRRVRDWMIDQFGLDVADNVLPDYQIGMLEAQPIESEVVGYGEKNKNVEPRAHHSSTGSLPVGRKESEMTEQEVRALLADEKKKTEAEFAEKLQAKDGEIATLRQAEREREKAERKKSIKEFCEAHKDRVIPAWTKMGIEDFIERLDALEDDGGAPLVIEFGDPSTSSGQRKKMSLRAWFESFVESLPKVIELKELGQRGVHVMGGAAERESLIADFMEKKKLGYKDAAVEVSKQRPELFQ